MRYMSCQPATLYFAWQLDVMLYNFIDVGINPTDIDVVCGVQGDVDLYFNELKQKYYDVNFYFYDDLRTDKSYTSSIRPHILHQHFKANPHLSNEAIFYHDCDIAFTRMPNFDKFLKDNISYVSDTRSYIGYNYIIKKGKDVFDKMVEVANIKPSLVIDNENNSGGAQYLLKNVNHLFWKCVEMDSTNLFREITKLNKEKKKQDLDYHPLQIWCADMWGVLWNLWKNKKQTRIIPEMNFMFATDPISHWQEKLIYHNAGVVNDRSGLFYKGKYMREIPPNTLKINQTQASYNYYEIVKKALY